MFHSRWVLLILDRLPSCLVKRPAVKKHDTCANVEPVTRWRLVNTITVRVYAAFHFVEAHLLAKQITQLCKRREINGLQESDFSIAYALHDEALHLGQLFVTELGKCGDAWFYAVITLLGCG